MSIDAIIPVIPCLDIMNGRVVKGVHFAGMRDAGDPVECAARYAAEGADEIGFLDIRASIEGRATRLSMIQNAVKAVTPVPVLIGGGIGSLEDIETVLAAGAAKVGIGSAAFANPSLIGEAAKRFGSERITSLVDVRPCGEGRWECTVASGQQSAGHDMLAWSRRMEQEGAGAILLTTMQDGARTGYDLAATRAVADAVSVPVIASGGAGTLEDFLLAVTEGHARGVLAASVFHFGTYTVAQVKQYLQENGVRVRL